MRHWNDRVTRVTLYSAMSCNVSCHFFVIGMLINMAFVGLFVPQMQGGQWEYVSDSAKELISQMLQVDPDKRITVDEALEHPWIIVSQP